MKTGLACQTMLGAAFHGRGRNFHDPTKDEGGWGLKGHGFGAFRLA
jgi:hypothetical protein